ncbi:MAG TPA: accessory factor UbiK family protein [Gammaproteobacteria bacterium]|nr:accessory factor UbiK family protein [Gammaproteobacteria bacterium]
MLDPKALDRLSRRLSEAMPESARLLQQDMEKNLRALLASTLERLDLVTREEFEAQKGVLERTRQKLEALERQVAAMEAALDHKESKT